MMESFQEFINIFKRNVATGNGADLTDLLRDSRKYFQNVPTDSTGLMLSELFDEKTGLLYFITNEFSRSKSNRSIDAALTETFRLIEFVLVQFHKFFEQKHITQIKNTCHSVLDSRCSLLIKKAAAHTFRKLIELFENQPYLHESVKKFVRSFHWLNVKERSLIFSVIGTIAKYHPEVHALESYNLNIFKMLQNDLKLQVETQSSLCAQNRGPLVEIKIYLNTYKDLLEKFQPPLSLRSQFYKELYDWIKDLSCATYSRAKDTLREAIDLLSRRMHFFADYVYRDYEYWQKMLLEMSKEQSIANAECGQYGLKAFYKTIGNRLSQNNTDVDKDKFLYFQKLFEEQLANKETDPTTFGLFLYGFSQLAAASNNYLPRNCINPMYMLIARCTYSLCFREDTDKQNFGNICAYQEALSEVIRNIPETSFNEISILVKLTVHIIKKFPEFLETGQTNVIYSLVKTIVNISGLKPSVFDEFIYNIIHDGIIWSCSHTLVIDAELQKEMQSTKERTLTYKNYLRLWVELLKPDRYYRNAHIAQQIYDVMIEVYITLINKLDLSIKTKENSILSDVALSMTAVNEADFRVFVNLTDLYIDVINSSELHFPQNTQNKLLHEITRMSYKNPLISSFYKMMRTVLTSSQTGSLAEETEYEPEIFNLVSKYLSNTLDLICTFSNELQTSCLFLILDAPVQFMKDIFNRAIPVFKIAFTIGLTEFDLAYTALNTLEKWTQHIENREMKSFLHEVVPTLEPYLQSEESAAEMLQDILKTERKVIKRVTLMDSEKTLENFQRRIFLFLGSLDSDIVLDYVHKRALHTGASWDKKDLLKYSIPFPDRKVDIHFDKILPRLIFLAENSGDRRTKLIACEMLHAIILFIFGNTSQLLQSDPERFAGLYKKLCPALLNLGCDSDDTARQLFQPLTLQTTHWLSSKFMLESAATGFFIESIYNGLCSTSNTALREFSGMCLAEFTNWSIKQCTDRDLEKTHVNIHAIIRRFANFALHPATSKRVAAAVGFNHLYRILRENDVIVSQYWLELLFCFVKSLEGCNDPCIHKALNHVERVLVVKKDMLNTPSQRRRKPPEFLEATLEEAVIWLLKQCGSIDQNCRRKSMKLHVDLSRQILKDDPEISMVKKFVDTHGIDGLNNIILRNVDPKMEFMSLKGMPYLLRSLDCYIWLIKEKLIDVKCLFTSFNPQKDVIFDCISNFVHLLTENKMDVEDVEITNESEALQTLRCRTIMFLLEFTETLLNLKETDITILLNKNLLKLISLCIMTPRAIGFDTKNLDQTEALPKQLERLLCIIRDNNDEALLESLNTELKAHVDEHISNLFELTEITMTNNSNESKEFLNGLILLKRCDVLYRLYKNETDDIKSINRMFKILVKQEDGKYYCGNYTSTAATEYIQKLMELLLINYSNRITKTLLELIEWNNLIEDTEPCQLTVGENFLNTYKDVIFPYMLKNVENTVEQVIALYKDNEPILLSFTEKFMLFVQRHRKEFQCYTEVLANELLKHFIIFKSAVNNVNHRNQQLMNIYGIVVRLKQKPTNAIIMNEDLWEWIAQQIAEMDDVDYKTDILRNFLICMADMTFHKPSLSLVLRNLKYSVFTLPPRASQVTNDTNALKTINCYNTILSFLPLTKSVVLFEFVVLFAAGISDYVYNEKIKDYLRSYFSSISSDYVLKSLEAAYKLFMDSSTKNNQKMEILQNFLIPSFEYCNVAEIERFFEKNIGELCKIINRSLVGEDEDVKRLIIFKIASYELIAIMFAKVSLRNIENEEGPIAKNALANISSEETLEEYVTGNAYKVRALKTMNSEHKEILRRLHCSAYNCCIAIISLKEDEESYSSLFAEDKQTNLIWKNIINCEKTYKFRQTLDEYPKHRKKLINIRKSMHSHHGEAKLSHSYIHRYDLSTTTLTDNVNVYDFHEATVLPKSNETNQETSMSLTFESDDLNDHECMASICGLLTHMITNEISVPPDEKNVVMPKWLKHFHTAMFSNQNNITLFLLKVILNVQAVFKPYAKFFLHPMMRGTQMNLQKNGFNYMVTDALVVLMDWHTVAIPSEDADKLCAQKLVELIIEKVMVDNPSPMYKGIYKYNLSIIATLMETWRSILTVPSRLEEKMLSSPNATVHIILLCLFNDMQEQIIHEDNILEFLLNSLEVWKNNEETALQSCQAIGLTLRFLKNDNNFEEKKNEAIEAVKKIFRHMQFVSVNKLLKCVRAFCKGYPEAAEDFFEFTFASITKADAVGKANCLEIFLMYIRQKTEEDIIKLLGYIRFSMFLEDKIALCEDVSLRIINNLVPVFSAANLLPLAKLVPPYTTHKLAEYRETAYNIFMGVHKRYSADVSEDENVTELIRLSCQVLLTGLLDPNDSLQEKVLKFWAEDAKLKDKSKDRLLEVLKLYSPTAEDVFLPLLPLVMFDLASKSEDFDKPMFKALHKDFKEYKIAISWRRRNLRSMTPLFAPSLASEINQSFTQASSFTHDQSFNDSTDADMELRATQDLQFEPTLPDDDEFVAIPLPETHEQDEVFKVPKIPEPAYNRRSKRFLRSSTITTLAMRQKEMNKNLQRTEMMKEEVIRQRSSVKLYRKYRIGDFPDTEISHSALITPLQALVKKDDVICKDLTVSLFRSLVEKVKNEEDADEFFADVANILENILRNCQGNNPIIAATLEIMLNFRVANCDPNIVTKVAKSNGLNSVGILLLEENLIHGKTGQEPEPKKARNENVISASSNQWVQLASLYESINEVDVVLSIFRRQDCGKSMQQASIARAMNKWTTAKEAYKQAFEEETGVVKEHSLQGLFECLKNLSDWNEIDNNIGKRLNGNCNNIWEDEWKDWMFPWLFHLHTFRLCLHDLSESFNGFKSTLLGWLTDKNKLRYIERLFGEELAIFTLNINREKARSFFMKNIDDIRDQWIRMNPLSTQLRAQILTKLRRINDINVYLKSFKATDRTCALKDLAKFWRKSEPLPQDDLFTWEKVISYRVYFLSLLQEEVNLTQNNSTETPEDDEETEAFRNLRFASFELKIKFIDLALHQRNKRITKQYLIRMEREAKEYPPSSHEAFILSVARFNVLAGETMQDIRKRVSKYATSFEHCRQLLNMPDLSSATNVAGRKLMSTTCSTLTKLISEDNEFANALTQNAVILREINAESNDIVDIKRALESYSFRNLKQCCEIASSRELAACYFALSKYCYERLVISSNDMSLAREFVTSTLKAMSYGSLDAAHYFPCLLKEEYLLDEQTRVDFVKISEIIPTWLFLSWRAQLFSHLGTSIAPVVIPIIEKIVEMYPNAVIYSFRLTVETNPSLLNDEATYKIRKALYDRPEVERFLSAMQYVVQPELYLIHYLMEVLKNQSLGRATALDILMKKVYNLEIENTNDPKPGNIYREISKFRKKVKDIEVKTDKQVEQYILLLRREILDNLDKRQDRSRLKDYSPWLHEYAGENLEIPGQYTGDRKPLPQYHAKIMKIEPVVKVMQSLRKPIRITMVGNDAKNYNFLVKFGEDLRLDQRLQQLFMTMNKALNNDVACKDRRLSVDTYQVIPLSRSLGIIQWVNNTRPLQDLINFTLPTKEIQRYNALSNDYANWIRMAAPRKKQSEQYKEAVSKYDATKVIEKMNELVSKTDRDALRNTFLMLAPSPESFVSLRHNFITSYATLCVAHWILGIGDRHLGNTLVEVESGRSLGIDFGLAFGAGVDQSVPELMPFRLTPQILGLLRPFTEKDLFGATMIHVLTALRNDQGPITACMDVFLHEPLNWTEHVNKLLKEKEEEEEEIDIKWKPKKKIDVVMKKLQGIKPSLVTVEQLMENHNDQYLQKYTAIINGEENINGGRFKMKNDHLSPQEQVECLLDQATDLNVLGRTYVGWKPWL